jgi:HPt (histidine-containing phosphotransfer) domain-containing protein
MPAGTQLNLDYLHEVAGDNPAIMCEVIDVFLEHAPALVTELRRLSEARDATGLRRVAHKLKPMLAYVGMTALHGKAVEVEAANFEGMDWGRVAELVQPLFAGFDAARAELAAFRATLPGTKPP